MKLKKLHKMGDVENTILKYFKKEKIVIGKIRSHIFSIFIFKSLLSSNYRIYQIKIHMKIGIIQKHLQT
ncbi:MAG: hypothetical protein COU45_02260 [Nitrosopumilus sp. CG10_big_fil_rev_8_21_14_0_10_33_7]|nr:MAG: hypothetical protein COU45_02260 [Nitrosopumilus sp. CG10_big_fil_rev_8_21_14_0_10_33_7]